MNDRFKFRVWRPKNIFVKFWKPKYIYFTLDMGEYAIGFTETDIIEQCTGLKDKNGKLIYEGDIVYSPLDGGTTKIIYFDDGLASFMAYNKDTDIRNSHQIADGYLIELGFEVIGNIHENADLLGENR